MRQFFVSLILISFLQCSIQDPSFWNNIGQEQLKKSLKQLQNNNKAKNVILFIGDGMGISTVTAARILKGQLNGDPGEEYLLAFEEWPHVALSKTYLPDRQTADSAATATALLSGIKTDYYVVGLDDTAEYLNCSSSKGKEVSNIIDWSEEEGKSTGIVTTARITHATPAAGYAHSATRDWEGDVWMENVTGGCVDIAKQLIQKGGKIEVVMGGGRYFFLPDNLKDPETDKIHRRQRRDKVNLVTKWMDMREEEGSRYKYVWTKEGFDSIYPDEVDKVLGLFNPGHMDYELNRDKGPLGEPSLAEMTSKAIKILQKNANGFFLLVEGGRIDHGHHDGLAKHALHETLAFEEAIMEAMKLTNEEDTLMLVTADHSHVFNIGGYPKRGNPILGPVNPIRDYPSDGKAFTTLQYGNGPGFRHCNRTDPRDEDYNSASYVYNSGLHLESETHGGEDVAVYARGPMSHLVHGVQEQNYFVHVMSYASCVGGNKAHCATYKVPPPPPSDNLATMSFLDLYIVIFSIINFSLIL